MNPFSLEGRTALVTGANSGIGKAIAIAMGRAGAHVVCAGRSSSSETVASIDSAEDLHLDLADPVAATAVFEGRFIDILVNNAGIIRRADSTDLTETDWDDVIDVNLKAVFFLSQAFAKSYLGRGKENGSKAAIVNIVSLLSFQGGIRVASYTASKHGVAGLTKLLANEWAAKGINVNAIAPGYIETNNTEALRADPARSKAILERIPAGRWGQAADIAEAAVFLASPAARYIHGAVLNVDGGWLAR